MPDVLRRLGNRTLTFVGDSISVQVSTQFDWLIIPEEPELWSADA
jgi:hypothetical protein